MYALGRSVAFLEPYSRHDEYGLARFVVVPEEKLSRCVVDIDVERDAVDAIDMARVGDDEGVEHRLEV